MRARPALPISVLSRRCPYALLLPPWPAGLGDHGRQRPTTAAALCPGTRMDDRCPSKFPTNDRALNTKRLSAAFLTQTSPAVSCKASVPQGRSPRCAGCMLAVLRRPCLRDRRKTSTQLWLSGMEPRLALVVYAVMPARQRGLSRRGHRLAVAEKPVRQKDRTTTSGSVGICAC